MRRARLKILGQTACYHVICRITQGQLWLGVGEQAYLTALLPRVAAYCGVEIITFCVMNNHFHLLVRVPEKAAADAAVNEVSLLNRVARLYGSTAAAELRALASPPTEEAKQVWESARAMHLGRMHDLSVFMKLLKQRFTMWHNFRHGTRGTLWTERFKSLLVETTEGPRSPLAIVAAYIDLNPVRAGVVAEAKEYPYSGAGSAAMGDAESQQGLVALGKSAKAWYDQLLADEPQESVSQASSAPTLRNRQSALIKGLVLGSAAFVFDVLAMMMSLRGNIRPQRFASGGSIGDLWVGRKFRGG